MRAIQIKDGKAVNFIVVDALSDRADLVAWRAGVEIGFNYDAHSDTFTDPVSPAEKRAAERESMRISRAEFAVRAAQAGIVTEQEALDWVGGTALPAAVLDVFNGLPEKEQFAAKAEALTLGELRRTAPLIEALRAGMRLSDEATDALFI